MAVGAVTVAAAIVLPVTLQVLPTATMARSGVVKAINPDLLETLGWPEMVGTVESVAQTLPTGERPSATVLTSNYTEASMLSVYARPGDLPVLGCQNSAWMWGRPDLLAGTVVAVGFQRDELTRWWGDVQPAAVVTNRYGAPNKEEGERVFICRDPTAAPGRIWYAIRRDS